MPLPKRCVEPVHVSRGVVPDRLAVPSELEVVTNGTLANTVKQLSSLSKHAEDMFGELTREATAQYERTNVLQERIDRLAVKVTKLDSCGEEVSLQDIQMRKAYRSSRAFDQQLFSRGSMPTAMLATYARCDPPPPLDRLNEFRDDGKDAKKFYTDPGYFFELWRREMLQDTERIQHDRGKKVRQVRGGAAGELRTARRVRQPHSTRERQRAAAVTRGEHIMTPTELHHYTANLDNTSYTDSASTVDGGQYGRTSVGRGSNRPSSIDIEAQPYRLTGNGHVMGEESVYGSVGGAGGVVSPSTGSEGAGTPRRARPTQPPPAPPAPALSPVPADHHTPTRGGLGPPPPPPEGAALPAALHNGAASPPHALAHAHRTPLDAHLDHMHKVIGMMSEDSMEECVPLPPPPPPEPMSPGGGSGGAAGAPRQSRPAPPSAAALQLGASALKPPQQQQQQPAPPDPRSDLLKAIRDGITLRKVEKPTDDGPGRFDTIRGMPHDVASILARRVAVELSDTDSAGNSDSEDSDGWSESRA